MEDAPLEQWPALLAAITDLHGTITGILRTWLDRSRPAKAPLADPRRALGHLLGNAVRFGDASDILPPAKASRPCSHSNPSCRCCPWPPVFRPTISPPSSCPPALRRLYVARDNDAAGIKAAERLRERADGIDVRELVPIHGDFNLDLCRLGPDGMRAHLTDQFVSSDLTRFLPDGRRIDRQR